MSTEIVFSSGDTSDPIPTVVLYGELADAFETPCSLSVHDAGGRIVIGEAGIVLSLLFDEGDNPVSVLADISPDAELRHVAALCRVVRKLGWDFWPPSPAGGRVKA